MTEKKRFEYKNHKVFDNLTGEEHSSNMVSVNVLNQLARVNREGVKKVQKLAKENEQLKQAYTQLKHRHSLLHDVCIDAECDRDGYRKDVVSLEKENEQLKQELTVYYRLIDNLFHTKEEYTSNLTYEKVNKELKE